METTNKTKITVEATVNSTIEKAWHMWNSPEHITKWCAASDDWHAPFAENDLKVGGKSTTTMAAKDGSFSFDFSWIYTTIKENELLEYVLEDGREVSVQFSKTANGIKVVEIFDPENENPPEFQQQGWQAILNNFKKHVEQN